MKLAVTYANGEVFQHFGKTENFKIYEIEDGKVVSSEVVGNDGLGHEALAGLLADKDVKVLICGGMGQGAKDALSEAGLEVYSGAVGDADAAVEAYLKGELISQDVNCDHHDHEHGHGHDKEEQEEEACGGCAGDCESGCGGECGGCSGCGEPRIFIEGPNAGKIVKVHYKGTLNDGTQFDSSYDRGEPLQFICGAGMMIKGFDAAVVDMKVGEKKSVHLMPEDAYGMPDESQIFTLNIAELPGSEDLNAGEMAYLTNQFGQPFPVKVAAKDDTTITFDANHEMAGKELNFDIELVDLI
ncbi:MAG: FKBP-type peptidyl-prolyl cis-trans isomerase [Lachnospiraceae bacterium]|nr:FKBP-type peptidyl-prolyl cis-trans isomerase [Lachnospiraceae bacterium]